MVFRRLISADAAIMLVSTIVTLLLGEAVVRLSVGQQFVMFPRNHAAAQYGNYTLRSMTPHATFWHQSKDGQWRFETNNKGFRDSRPYEHAKPDGTFRVLVLGDSHSAGFESHQDDTFAAVLQRRLNAQGVKAEVLNTGVSGMGTAEQLVFLEQEGIKYKPDAVVVAFFANDFSDNMRSGLFRVDGGTLVETNNRYYAPAVDVIGTMNAIPGVKWLSENSYLFSLALNTVWELYKSRSVNKERQAAGAEVAVQTQDAASPHEIELARHLLQRLARFADRHGIRPILVDIASSTKKPYESSVPAVLRPDIVKAFPTVLWSEDYLGQLPPGQVAHVPHGHQHISRYAHAKIGETLADRLKIKSAASTLLHRPTSAAPDTR